MHVRAVTAVGRGELMIFICPLNQGAGDFPGG